ncbi:Serine/threonine-protein kinase RsbT [Caballeronia terrestris]|jgi:anti-sigma regulatory factor (Ser/Thr protein kinase)|uniref:Serine/threonine-protein kinase RsbT n=1 Tax=Caballeronia terrestris TaxID=1226301 RepID=A0A158ICY0_9BURK|nr:ATP-binding SpoIIE family protein phosphatase [Caballeronia terrestris]SAL54317.1 Serine/threonine-protein kinase RsbT [Caballeronia terrestris]
MEATINLSDQSGVAHARRSVVALARSLELTERVQADASLVVSEAATNILKYARSGTIHIAPYADCTGSGLEIVAVDRGPGIVNVEAARTDGFSTGGSLGAGLGTIERQSALFDFYSIAGGGTVLLARIGSKGASAAKPCAWTIGAKSTPKLGQQICGDAWSALEDDGILWLTLLDGLGHGPLASEASRRAVDVFRQRNRDDTPADVLRAAHEAMRSTRGAVMAAAKFDPKAKSMKYAGVGNIVAIVNTGEVNQHLVSTDGTVGYNMRLVRESTVDWNVRSVFIATTDGLSTRWNLNRHPDLLRHHPVVIAHVLHRDFARDNDDASIVVVKAA